MSARTSKPAPEVKRPEIVEGTELIHYHGNGRERSVVRVIRRTATRLIVDGWHTPRPFSADSLYVPGASGWHRERVEVPRNAAHLAEVREEAKRRAIAERCRRYAWSELPTPALDQIAKILDAIEMRRSEHPA